MSLSRELFSMSLPQQEAAIKTLAKKYIDYADAHGINRRRVFGKFIHDTLRIKHKAGAPKSELNDLQRRWRRWFHEVSITIPDAPHVNLAACPTTTVNV